MYGRRGTTYGSTYLTDRYSPAAERSVRHESKHADQWSWFGGGPLFGIVYLGTEAVRGGLATPGNGWPGSGTAATTTAAAANR